MSQGGGAVGRLAVQLRIAPGALARLRGAVGVLALPGLLWRVWRRERRGEPWGALDPPVSEREQACRDQIRQAVLFYDELSERLGKERSLEVVREIVREAAVIQLRYWIPAFGRARYQAMTREEREALLRDIVDRFPNATVGDLDVRDEAFSYPVTRCELVELCRRIGRPEMASAFCAGDALFFERHMPEVSFDRPGTIAEGGACCDFRFTWKKTP